MVNARLDANSNVSEHEKVLQAAAKKDKQQINSLEKELRRKEEALAETAALLVLRKSQCDLWRSRGRMTLDADRLQAVKLLDEAVLSGAAKYKTCAELGITIRTYQC